MATIKDVLRKNGISQAMVSRVLSRMRPYQLNTRGRFFASLRNIRKTAPQPVEIFIIVIFEWYTLEELR